MPPENGAEPATSAPRRPLLMAIVAFKFAKGAVFLAAATALLIYRRQPAAELFLHAADFANGDPRLRVSAGILRELSFAFELHFPAVVTACGLGGAALFTEAICLLLGYTWAPWMTIVLTGVWIPVELYELEHRFAWRTLAIAAVNILVVVYLYRHRREFHRRLGEHARGSD